jgi:DNA repair protein SbcC/Rad50
MIKIKKLIIRNFQSHRDSEIELSGGLDAIYGASDVGKSAILRALECLLFRSKFYIRNGETDALVKCTFDNGLSLSRFRNIKPNNISEKYLLGTTVFRKIGKTLPEEITNATKLKPIVLNDGSLLNLNLQTQHESKFLLADGEYSSAYRARVTSLSGSEVLDLASLEAAKDHRKTKSDLNYVSDSELHEANEGLSRLDGLSTNLEDLKSIKTMKDDIDKKYIILEKLKELSTKKKNVDSINIYDKTDIISVLITLIKNLNILLLSKKYQQINIPIYIPSELPKLDGIYKLKECLSILINLKKIKSDLIKSHSNFAELNNNKELIISEFESFKSTINTCPLCESQL